MKELKLNYTLSEDGCYITLEDGRVFEQIKGDLASIELDLDMELLKDMEIAIDLENYVSKQEYIRAAMRNMLQQDCLNLEKKEK